MFMKTENILGLAVLLVFFGELSIFAADSPLKIEVQAGETPIFELPVTTDLPDGVDAKALALRDATTGEIHAAQIHSDGGKRQLTWVIDALDAWKKRVYVVEKAAPPKKGKGVELRRTGANLDILIDGELFTTYVTEGAGRPYCWPMIGPTGKPMTRAYPMREGVEGEDDDHEHHRSFWFGYDKVNGEDFWRYGKSSTVHKELLDVTSGPVFGEFTARVEWIGKKSGKKVCEDVRRMRVYRTGTARVFDFRIELKASEGPLQLGDSEEGMLGFRVAGTMKVESGGTILNARGARDKDAWGKRAPWCDYSGSLEGEVVGVAIFDNPKNIRHPTYWHVRPYGLFCANRFGIHDFTDQGDGSLRLDAGESLAQDFRLYLHRGHAAEARVAEYYASFAEPPQVRWTGAPKDGG